MKLSVITISSLIAISMAQCKTNSEEKPKDATLTGEQHKELIEKNRVEADSLFKEDGSCPACGMG